MKARIEYRYDAAHPAYLELQREADLRGVNLQQHINDLLIGRYLARHNLAPLSDLLWLPVAPEAAPNDSASTAATTGAHVLADEWM